MSAILIIAVPACIAASACDNAQPTKPANPIVVRSEAQDQLHQLDQINLAIAMRRAINDSGTRCRRVTDAGYVQEHGNLSMWTASCDDGRSWGVFAGPDGSAQVRPCQDLVALKLPACKITKRPPA